MKRTLIIALTLLVLVVACEEKADWEKTTEERIMERSDLLEEKQSRKIAVPEDKMLNVAERYEDKADKLKDLDLTIYKDISEQSLPSFLDTPDETINFDHGVIDIEEITMPASITYGPDGKLYVGQLDGSIVAITLPSEGKIEAEYISRPGTFEQILGLTFNQNEVSDFPTLYVSHSRLHTKSEESPFLGKISKITSPNFEPEIVISGLPVQNGDHANNGIVFDNEGKLFIAQGGSTNAGFPTKPLDRPETPLSGAILVADISDSNFNGKIEYDTKHASHETNQISGDVKVFATGFRNPFDLVIHSNGNLYSTDNGPSKFFPGVSNDCSSHNIIGVDGPDELNLVIEDNFYGHPNRNRGRFDENECVYYSGSNKSPKHNAPVANLGSFVSANGIVEYKSKSFEGKMVGDLIYVDFNYGRIWRVILSETGRGISAISQLHEGIGEGAVDLALSPDGSIFVTHVGGVIFYLSPSSE